MLGKSLAEVRRFPFLDTLQIFALQALQAEQARERADLAQAQAAVSSKFKN